jgi:signal transduction histidine kinase
MLLYTSLFVLCGAGLVVITYQLVEHFSGHVSLARSGPVTYARSAGGSATAPPRLPPLARLQQNDLSRQRTSDLHELLVWSLAALAAMAIVSIALGWMVAGRVLGPVRIMTAAVRRISHDNLHERLALTGPDDELKELGETFDDLLARLEGAFEAQRWFVANASHELRTPLARIRTALDVAVAKPAAPPQVHALDGKIRDGLDRADRLLEGLLELGRAQHGELSDRDEVSLAQVVDAALCDHRLEIAAGGIALQHGLRPVTVSGSPTLLGRMVENVIDNAIRHNVANGWMSVELDALGDRARLTVKSSGDVLDATRVADLAQPFMRLAADRTGSDRGHGLGLSIVAAIVTAHDGTLRLHPRAQGGLAVVIELPCTAQTTDIPA